VGCRAARRDRRGGGHLDRLHHARASPGHAPDGGPRWS
jgi:hypothetical protein